MGEPIRAALEKAACAMCICEGECFETRHGMMNGPCEKQIEKAATVVNAFIFALPPLLTWEIGAHHLKQVARIEELERVLRDLMLPQTPASFAGSMRAARLALGTSGEQR